MATVLWPAVDQNAIHIYHQSANSQRFLGVVRARARHARATTMVRYRLLGWYDSRARRSTLNERRGKHQDSTAAD
jgi:hypothetical protein